MGIRLRLCYMQRCEDDESRRLCPKGKTVSTVETAV
jgi:hypothetical protein